MMNLNAVPSCEPVSLVAEPTAERIPLNSSNDNPATLAAVPDIFIASAIV